MILSDLSLNMRTYLIILFEYEKALQKSFESYQKGQLDKATHELHKSNLNPKIFQYKQAIELLKHW